MEKLNFGTVSLTFFANFNIISFLQAVYPIMKEFTEIESCIEVKL